MKILSGTSNIKLSKNISKQLKLKLVNTNIKDSQMVKFILRLMRISEVTVFLLFSQHLILQMII